MASESFSVTPEMESHFLHSLMDHFSERIYFKDLESRILYGNRSYLQLFQRGSLAEILGKKDSDFFTDHHASQALEDEQQIIRTGTPKLEMEEKETWPDGSITWCSTSKVPLRNGQGQIIGTLGISRDITEQKQTQEALQASEARYRQISEELAAVNRQLGEANAKLQELSFKDPLTSLWNRRFVVDQMPEDVALVERAHRNISDNALERMKRNVDMLFLMVDIDHFKQVNDRFGHLAGDQVLRQMGTILRRVARTSDMVARVGGEEFLLVARQMARADSHIVAERIRAGVEKHAFRIDEKTSIRCTCSVGFSVYPLFLSEPAVWGWEQIVEIADHCLYAAKNSGRNSWVGVIPDERALQLDALTVPTDIARLVRSGLLPTMTSLKTPVVWRD